MKCREEKSLSGRAVCTDPKMNGLPCEELQLSGLDLLVLCQQAYVRMKRRTQG